MGSRGEDALTRPLHTREDIAPALDALGRRLGADRVVLSWFRLEQIVFGEQWTADGVAPLGLQLAVPFDALPSWTRRLRAGETVAYADAGRVEGIEGRWSASVGIGAVLSVPIECSGQVLGALSVHSRRPRPWTAADAEAVHARARELAHVVDAHVATPDDWRSLNFDALPVALAAIDDHGELIVGNQAMRDIGLRPGEPSTADDRIISDLGPENRERLYAALRPVLLGRVTTSATVIDVLGRQIEVRYFQTPPETGARALAVAVPLEPIVDVPAAADVPGALANGWMHLHYQAVLDRRGDVVGAEALARLFHPMVGQISPAQFVTLAEQTGTAPLLDRWALETAMHDHASLAAASADPATFLLSVNVSAESVRAGVVDHALATAVRHGLRPEQVQFELTERAALHAGSGRGELEDLRAAGFRIALDDFGAGYSAVGYLAEMALDTVKLDRSLVTSAALGGRAEIVARAVCRLADDLGLDIVAEGVETAAECDLVDSLGCSTWQGFLYGQAVPVADFPREDVDRPVTAPSPG